MKAERPNQRVTEKRFCLIELFLNLQGEAKSPCAQNVVRTILSLEP